MALAVVKRYARDFSATLSPHVDFLRKSPSSRHSHSLGEWSSSLEVGFFATSPLEVGF
ncbi:MAG TPA: hypothetical protein VMB35_05445 [Methanomicrobiales archaeon]|nr:hypothetical protein [Methanomicrobiales archaeon]